MIEDRNKNSTCGPYKLIRTIGQGGNAVVKLSEKDGVQYAIKMMLLTEQDSEFVIRKTKEEFDVVSKLCIKGVMKYYDFIPNAIWTNKNGEQKKVACLVMELLKGVELLEFLNESDGLDSETLRYIFLQVGATLHQLHKAGIAHRDIKLENIMITEDFEVKLIDLGYGLALEGRTGSGFMKSRLGTYMYMAPEIQDKTVQYQGQDGDCFALGVCILVCKLNDYPWKVPDMEQDVNYKLFAGYHGCDSDKFWAKFAKSNLSENFKNMIELMLAHDPSSRMTMSDILGHPWFRG